MEKTKQIIFKVPESIQRDFKSIAALRGKTMTDLFIEFVKILSDKSEIKNNVFTPEEVDQIKK